MGCVIIRLWAGRTGVRIPVGAGDCVIFEHVQTGYGTHPGSYSMLTGVTQINTNFLHDIYKVVQI